MNLHEEYFDFRDRVWKALEELVHTGCETIGQFPIVLGSLDLKATDKRSGVIIADTDTIIIRGIVKDEKYSVFYPKESDKDIYVNINKIKVIVQKDSIGQKGNAIKSLSWEMTEMEVEPDLLDLQELSTYLSGGFSVYKD